MSEGATIDAGGAHGLAAQLEPALRDACGGRLGPIRWFTSDWQRSGAATGNSVFSFDDAPRDVVVKLPVGPTERRFAAAMAERGAPTPGVAMAGAELGGYDLAWLVMERLPGAPIGRELTKPVLQDFAAAAAAFYGAAQKIGPPDRCPLPADWAQLLERAREAARVSDIRHAQRWNEAIKRAQKAAPRLVRVWETRDASSWRHGDLHPGNVMRREEGSPWGAPGCVLIDLADVTPGHWVEDAVYFERLYWSREEELRGVKPVKLLARARKGAGLENGDNYQELADVRRLLTAACTPAFLHREGAPRHVEAALEVLEGALTRVGG